ncbi:hypothetical protein JTB14_029803 [Gonioctena quinquepunctata]|nr:hypothetical protein JTB14_029803 [Gonioctena quinquepunctata]
MEVERPPQGRGMDDPAFEQAAGSPVPAIGEIATRRERLMGETIELIQANLQHAKAPTQSAEDSPRSS